MTPLVANDEWAPRKSARQLNWSVGTVSAMKADVIHAGPPTEAYRVVMFFVACKGGQTYDADFQVSPFVFPLLLRSMDPLATLKYCSMYTDRKPWEFLEDVLDVDGDGFITEEELMKVAASFGGAPAPDRDLVPMKHNTAALRLDLLWGLSLGIQKQVEKKRIILYNQTR